MKKQNENVTAACTAGTGESTTRTNDVQATVTEENVATILKKVDAYTKKQWWEGSAVAKWLRDDGMCMYLRKNGEKYYLALWGGNQPYEQCEEFTLWQATVDSMRKFLMQAYTNHTGRTLATCLMDAIMAEILSSPDAAGTVLEWQYGLEMRASEDKILKAYGLL